MRAHLRHAHATHQCSLLLLSLTIPLDVCRTTDVGLENILCGSMDATMFKTQLRQTFGIRLSASELGALFKAFDLDGRCVCLLTYKLILEC
jgi:hypothetical protein